ncbi:hypothetical protein [Actinomadura chokoriensis]|uniref:hypothetical protein n=1 Tax=Actinomadura chokoriensis TaxID=454156 RepID=UPI0031F77AF4
MTNAEIGQRVYAVLAAELAEDADGLHELLAPLDRDELDFVLTGVLSTVAGLLVSDAKQAGHGDPRAAALATVRGMALRAADEEGGR